jgi:hypothetical protein
VGGPDTGVAQTIDGVIPQSAGQGIGYGPMNQLVTASGAVALAGAPRGGITIQRTDGAWQVYFASAAKIQVLDSTYDWDDIETGRTTPPDGYNVSFAPFGNYLLNTDLSNGFKAYNYQAGGTNDVVSAAPTAAGVCVSNNVVFAYNLSTDNRRMKSSAQGDHTNWTTEGADGKTFEDGGAINAMRDMRGGLCAIFQENAIRMIQFGAGPTSTTLYGITKIADGIGAVSELAVTAYDGTARWVSTAGIYELVAGGVPTPIGDQKVNRWLAAQVAATDFAAIQAADDPARKMTWFRLSSSLLLGYHWLIRDFVTATVSTTALQRFATPAVVIDDISTIIDNLNVTIDSLDFQGGAPAFGALDSSYKFARFTGTPMAADLRSCVTSAGSSQRFLQATPISDASTSSLRLGTSSNISTALSYSDPQTRDSDDGACRFDERGRYFAFRETIAAGTTWTFSNGVDGIVSNPDAP